MNNWDIGDRTLCDRAGEACNEHELCMVVVPRKSCCRPRRWRLLIWGWQSFPRWIEWCSERGSWDQTRRSPAEWSSPKSRSRTEMTRSVIRSLCSNHTKTAVSTPIHQMAVSGGYALSTNGDRRNYKKIAENFHEILGTVRPWNKNSQLHFGMICVLWLLK